MRQVIVAEGGIHFYDVETPEQVEDVVKAFDAIGNEFEGGDESLCHICHVKSPYGPLYFYAVDEETARNIWEHWFPEEKESRLEAEKQQAEDDEYERQAWANYEKGGQG